MTSETSKRPVTGTRLVIGYIGVSSMLIGIMVLTPLLVLTVYRHDLPHATCFIFPGIITMLFGYLLYFLNIRGARRGPLQKNEDAIIIVFTWLIAIVSCSVPFLLTGEFTVSQSVFETMSGLTTTGLSIVDVQSCPNIFLIHRSLLHFFGGIGLVLVMVTALSNAHGLRVYNAEGHTDKLLPNMVDSARLILAMYTGFILAGTVAYRIAGVPLFDAVNTAISAVSTGGFTVTPGSIGDYNSVPVEIISIVLMLVGAVNFLENFLLLRGRFHAYCNHAETKVLGAVVVGFSVTTALILLAFGTVNALPKALRVGLFETVSVLTSTGFSIIPSISVLPPAVIFLFVILMFMGGQAGSTAGGIKLHRIVVVVKSLIWSFRDRYGHHRNVYSYKIHRFGKYIECTDKERREVFLFLGMYVTLFFLGSFLFMLMGASMQDATFEFASCIGNTGVSIGLIQASSNPALLWIGAIGMFFGRLEIVPVFLAFRRIGGKIRERVTYGNENQA